MKAEVKAEADEGNKSASSADLCLGVQSVEQQLEQQLEASEHFERIDAANNVMTRERAMNMGDKEADDWWDNVQEAQDKIGEECGAAEAASKAAKAAEIEFIRQQQQKMAIALLQDAGIQEEAEEDAGAAAPAAAPAAAAGGIAEEAAPEAPLPEAAAAAPAPAGDDDDCGMAY
jgi:hypothetical protein